MRSRSHPPDHRHQGPRSATGQPYIEKNQVAELTLRTKAPLAFDLRHTFETTGRFVLVDEYDIAGGGIITELVHDEQEILRDEARRRDFAWVKGEVSVGSRAQHYGHRAAIILFTGGRHTGKSFLARKLEGALWRMGAMAIYWMEKSCAAVGCRSERRRAGPNNGNGSALWRSSTPSTHTGLIVVSTTNPFGLAYREASQAIRDPLHPAPVIAVHMSKTEEEPPPNTDVVSAAPTWIPTRRLLESGRIKTPRRLSPSHRGKADLPVLDLARDQTGVI